MKTVVVTGASSGIGLAIAERFAKGGWAVAIIARDPARLAEAKEFVERQGGRVLAISADVADSVAIDAAASQVEQELGGIDAWVNNAMSTVVAPADDITPNEYARVTATTYLSQVHGTLSALKHMRGRGCGAIVQISSGLAIRAAPLQAAYCGAKAAVTGFTDSLRSELIAQKSDISLTVVYMPGVNTPQPQWARNRTGRQQEIPDPLFDPRLCAEAVWSAVARPQREIWVGRSTAMMAAAHRLAPTFADRQAAGMIEKQQGAPMAARDGNLDIPVAGSASVDGPESNRVIDTKAEFFTSRHRTIAQAGAALGLVGAGIVAGMILPGLRGKQPR